MENKENRKGFLGLFPRWVDLFVLCLCLYGFIWLQWWSLPRQPAFLVFIISLESIIFLLSFFFPSWGLFLVITVIPGITTSSLTIFNKINPTVKIGVFGPAALIPALAYVFGVWLRTSLKKEDLQPNLLRTPLNYFMGLTILSAFITLWRYSDFWPITGWNMVDRVVNVDGLTASTANQSIIWTLINYLTGPLFFLAICQASWKKIKYGKILWRAWILKYIFAPFFVGSVAPIVVGLIQKKDVWFGAHKFYIWPWMNRINATFFDPNALGSYLIIAIPMVLAGVILLISLSRWLILPAIAVGGCYIYCFIIFIANSGSRISFIGLILVLLFALTFFLIIQIEKLKPKVAPITFKAICSISIIIYVSLALFSVYSTPRMLQQLKSNNKLSKTSLVKRLVKMDINSIGDVYNNIKKDRGVYARIAVKIIKDVPLTGIGLGSFISELPNYRKFTKELVYVPDTACNYYLQIGAEQGLITLVIVFFIFAVCLMKWWRVMNYAGIYMYWIFVGAGIATMFVVFLFGMHTLAHEIQCLFWICLAQPFIAQPQGWEKQIGSKYLKLLLFIICVIYVCVSILKLSLEKQRKKFGWNDNSQFYQWEKWSDPNVPFVRYSKKESSEDIKCLKTFLKQRWCALYPDIKENPVEISFQLGNQITNILAEDNDWHTMEIKVNPKSLNENVLYSVNVNRTWKASTLGMKNDKRKLGLLLNKISWKNSIGMYKKEKWQDDGSVMANKEYSWTEKDAELAITLNEKYIKIPLLIGQPDVVTINVGINKTNLAELIVANNAWQEIILFCGHIFNPNEKKKNAVLNFNVDKTMTPEKFGISDGRTLGVAVGNPVSIKDFGFYNKEKWEDDYYYRWAGKEARWAEKSNTNGLINILYFVNHPDILDESVEISFYVNGERKMIKDVYYPNWKTIELHGKTNSWNDIIVKVNRTWKPKEFGVSDDRKLGFAIKCNQ